MAAQTSGSGSKRGESGSSEPDSRQVCFGIDLGTSNCSVAYVVPPRRKVAVQAKVVDFPFGRDRGERSARFPSVIAKKGTEKDGRRAAFGFDAEGKNLESFGVDCFRSIKSHLGTLRSFLRAYIDDFNTPVKAWGLLIERLCDLTVKATPDKLDPRRYHTVLTVPASFDLRRRKETLDAAERAGFKRDWITLIDEPVAALIDWISGPDADLTLVQGDEWRNVLVFDFGGGTCDLSLVAVRVASQSTLGLEVKNLAISPFGLLGGDTIDQAIMAYLWPQIAQLNGITRAELTARDQKRIEDANWLACRKLKERMCESLEKLSSSDRKRGRWGKTAVKWLLSPTSLSTGQKIAGRVELSAELFHRVMQPFLNPAGELYPITESAKAYPLTRLIENILARAGLECSDLNVILLNGGSCKNPLVRDALEVMVGQGTLFADCKITETPDLETSVASGAALHGHFLHNEGQWLVHPIIAEPIGIVARGDKYEVLVTEGTRLPFPETGWHPIRGRFVTSRANQKAMLVPLYVGEAPEGHWPRVAASMSEKLPPNLSDGHVIDVNVRIDADKLTKLQFKPVGDYPWTTAWRIDDPWVCQSHGSDAIEELLAIRSQIREHIAHGKPIPLWMRTQESFVAARAGHPHEAMVLIEEILEQHPDDADAWNTRGLVHSTRRETQARCDCYENAARLDTSNAVYRGNFGTALSDLGKYEQAVMEMRAALAMNSSLRYLHSWLATSFERLNQPEEAKKELNRWLDAARRRATAEPEAVAGWRDLETVCRRLGHYDEADESQRKAVQLMRTKHVGGSPDDLLTSARW